MFDKLNKNQKIIFYFFILISFIFILPILFWIGFFIGYKTSKNAMTYQIQTTLESEKNDVDNDYLEINI